MTSRITLFASALSGLALFAATFVAFGTMPASPLVSVVGALAHVALFPVVLGLRGPAWGVAAGVGWLVTDIAANVMTLNGVDPTIGAALRLGGHVPAALWIASLAPLGRIERILAFPLAFLLGGYSLAAPWVPEAVFFPAFILLLAWLGLITFSLRPSRVQNAEAPAGA